VTLYYHYYCALYIRILNCTVHVAYKLGRVPEMCEIAATASPFSRRRQIYRTFRLPPSRSTATRILSRQYYINTTEYVLKFSDRSMRICSNRVKQICMQILSNLSSYIMIRIRIKSYMRSNNNKKCSTIMFYK
jgi:hypothetical protein